MPHPRPRRLLVALGVAALGLSALVGSTTGPALADPSSGPTAPAKGRDVTLQILALNDFHGQLEPSTSSSSGVIDGIPAGGAAYLATHLDRLRRQAARQGRSSVTVAAGDLVGASPLISAAFHDEPTIETMNKLGLDISSVGNHEFDEGWRELVRLQRGGCLDDGDGADNQNSCPDHRFRGADFRYLSANVTHTDTGKTVFPAVAVRKYRGVKVGFIGMTLEATPDIVTKAGVEGLTFSDEVDTANRVAQRLDRRGVKAIVVLVHEGGYPSDPAAYDGCPGISGPIVDINKGLSPRIDAVISGHTHQAYTCRLRDPNYDQRVVTSAASLGRLVTDIRLDVDRRTHDVVRSSVRVHNRIVTQDVPKAAAVSRLVATYAALALPISSKVIGHLAGGTTTIARTTDDSGESPLGNLIADSQRTDGSTVTEGRAPEIAFMNPGGIRNDLLADASGAVTYGAASSVQPFNNYVVSMDLTGAQVLALLEEQWSGANAGEPRILQVSGITYSYRHPAGSSSYTLLENSVQVGGEPLDPTRTYRVAANSFLADGGDGFATFAEGGDPYVGGIDLDGLARYLAENDPYTTEPTDRITLAP